MADEDKVLTKAEANEIMSESQIKGMLPISIVLNGTDTNPFHVCGLTQNPFPQYPRYETLAAMMALNKLGGDPIPHDTAAEYIRSVLGGMWVEPIIDLCIRHFEPGKMKCFHLFVKKEFLT